ncbi:P-loop NTPase fold protein [Planktothrix prolifica]|uniref:P-loop NTPase fold protein n=1 Tax=Planktothrix prolifica TaxID=54307 RepID=UPI000413A9F6|nr:P-loop NTPase fold protein [Planktothrix prolifica]
METPISPENEHIENYLDFYCNLPTAPKFAVLIKGKWGSGKTWFIEQYRKKLKEKAKSERTGKKSLYVSLYGMTDCSEIQDSFFQQLYPLLTSKPVVVASQVMKAVAKVGVKIDDKLTWNILIPDIKDLPMKFNDSKFNLLVFDDLERCNIPIESLLGYINLFVNSEDLKVVIIGNEEELISKENKYQKFKEKLIGQTLEISPDLHAALNTFVEDIKNPKVKQIFHSNIDLIKILYNKSKCNNLRTLNKIVLDFERIFNDLPDKAKECPDIIKDIVEILIIFSIEIHQGNLEPSDIGKLISKLEEEDYAFSQMKNKQSQSVDKQKEIHEINNQLPYRKMFIKYDNIIISNYSATYKLKTLFPELDWWENFLNKGNVDRATLEKTISNSKYFEDEKTPNWRKLLYFYHYSDEKFKEILNSLDADYKERKYEKIDEVKNATILFFYFSDLGLYNKSKFDILQEAIEYINYLKDYNKLDWRIYEDETEDETHEKKSTFSEVLDYLEYKEFDSYLKKSKGQIRISKLTDESKNMLKIMEDNLDEFCNMINSSINDGFFNEKYYDYPIFLNTNAEEFINVISKIQNDKLKYLFKSLQLRYLDRNQNYIHSQGIKLIEEIDFLEQIQNLLLKLIEEREGELSGHLLKLAKENYLDIVVNKIKERKNT